MSSELERRPRVRRLWADGSPADGSDSGSKLGLEEFLQLLLGHQANVLRLDDTTLEQHQRRDAADAVFHRSTLAALDINFGYFEPILVLDGNLLEDWGDCLAGATPLGPEIHQHRPAGLQYLCFKRVIGDVNYAHGPLNDPVVRLGLTGFVVSIRKGDTTLSAPLPPRGLSVRAGRGPSLPRQVDSGASGGLHLEAGVKRGAG